MSRERSTCRCCDGTGIVPDMLGRPRPCSRCSDLQTWNAWAKQNCRGGVQTKPAPQPQPQQDTGK